MLLKFYNTFSLYSSRTYSKLSYIHNVGKEPLRALTLGNVLDLTVSKHPDRWAIISRPQKQQMTFSEFQLNSDKFAAGLSAIGLKQGDRVGLWSTNSVEWLVVAMACARIGLPLVTLNPAYRAKEIEYCINKAEVKALICPERSRRYEFCEVVHQLIPSLESCHPGKLNCENIPTLRNIIILTNKLVRGTYNYQEILELSNDEGVNSIKNNQHLIDPSSEINVQFTSGTTGNPKAAVVSHFNVVNNSYYVGKRNELNRKHHKICVQVPLFHAFGFTVSFAAALTHGSTLVIPDFVYNPLENLKALQDQRLPRQYQSQGWQRKILPLWLALEQEIDYKTECYAQGTLSEPERLAKKSLSKFKNFQNKFGNVTRCTVVYGTPTMYVDLVNLQREAQLDISPEIVLTGGSPCSPKLFKDIKSTLNVKRVKSIYGLSESTAVAFQSLPIEEDEYKVTETVGHIGDHIEAKVCNENGKMVPMGTPGELYLRGYNVMLGYFGDDKKTKETITKDWWLKTGDEFVLQKDGYGRIIGRIKDMIIRGGENIYPREIENFLVTHPNVLDAQVIGLKHERLGEEVCACLILKAGSELTQEDLKKFCRGKIAEYKIPSRLYIVDEFPTTASGKVKKYLLRETFDKKSS